MSTDWSKVGKDKTFTLEDIHGYPEPQLSEEEDAEIYMKFVNDARAGIGEAGRHALYACLWDMEHERKLDEPLASYLIEILTAALEANARDVSKAMRLTRAKHRPKGTVIYDKHIRKWYWSYLDGVIEDPPCDERTVRRWLNSAARATVDWKWENKIEFTPVAPLKPPLDND